MAMKVTDLFLDILFCLCCLWILIRERMMFPFKEVALLSGSESACQIAIHSLH